jgi:hypothetical protein
MLKVAEYISLHIPSPFIRIDFHRRGSELVCCEFTPRPGATWLYNRKADQMLGDAYLAAEGRLLKDFLAGKTFNIFNSIVRKDLCKDASCSQHAVQTSVPAADLLQKISTLEAPSNLALQRPEFDIAVPTSGGSLKQLPLRQ